MIKLKRLIEEVNWEELQKFTGSYKLQGHISREKNVDLKNTDPEDVASNIMPYGYSPPNGFWTSTIYKDVRNFSKKYFTTNWKKVPFVNPRGAYFHVFTVRGDPNVRHIDSEEDAETFGEKYLDSSDIDWSSKQKHLHIKWSEVSRDYDAVHALDSAFENELFEHWDVESTVWFNPKSYLKEQFVWKIGRRSLNTTWKDFGD